MSEQSFAYDLDADTLRWRLPPAQKAAAIGAVAVLSLSGSPEVDRPAEPAQAARIQIDAPGEPEIAPKPERKQPPIAIAWLPETVQHWEKDVAKICKKRYDLDPELIAIIMTLESGGWPEATSDSEPSSRGLVQIWQRTEGDIAKWRGIKPGSYDIYDPETNLDFGCWYLRHKLFDELPLDGYSQKEKVAIVTAGYNGGPGRALELIQHNLDYDAAAIGWQASNYSQKAAGMWEERHDKHSPTYEAWRTHPTLPGQWLLDKAEEWFKKQDIELPN